MGDEPVLDAAGLFQLACAEALHDRKVDPAEGLFLESLQRILKLPGAEAQAILVRVREELAAGGTPPGTRGLSSPKVFGDACRLAWLDGKVEPEERRILEHFGELLGLGSLAVAQLLTAAEPANRSTMPVQGVEVDAEQVARLAAAGPPPLRRARSVEEGEGEPAKPAPLPAPVLGLAIGVALGLLLLVLLRLASLG